MALPKNRLDREYKKFITGPNGEPSVSSMNSDFLIEVSKGNVPNHLIIKKFGANSAIGTTFEPITDTGTYQTPKVLTTLEIASNSINDDVGGTGARTVIVYGIGTNWLEIQEEVVMNGITPVTLSNQFFRVYRMRVKDSGTYADANSPTHDSTITLTGVTGSEVWATIHSEAGFGLSSTEIGVYSIPSGMTAYLLEVHLDIETTKLVDVLGFSREGTDVVTAPYTPMTAFFIKRAIDGEHYANGAPLLKLTGPADIGFMAKQSGGSSKAEVEFTLLCISE